MLALLRNDPLNNPAEVAKVGYCNPPAEHQFKPGNLANPGGKPVGARNKLNARFLNELIKQFDAHGAEAIRNCAENDPSTFVRVLASLQPKELEIKRPLDDISDEQLDAAYVAVRAILGAQNAGSGEGGQGQAQPAASLQAVPEAV